MIDEITGIGDIESFLKSGSKSVAVRRSEVAETRIKFEGRNISFERYRFSKKILDTKANSVIFKCGRQVGKSFTLSLAILTNLVTRPFTTFLYVAPTTDQARVFSNDKIEARIEESEEFKKVYLDKTCKRNVKEKSFINASKIYFRAETQLNSIRGISSNTNLFDEFQDIPGDSLGIINETMSGKDQASSTWYAGTPKNIFNEIETKWQKSNQIVPHLICGAGHLNYPSKEMIHDDYLRCSVCKERVDVNNCRYIRTGDKDSPIVGFWIPQIALPVHTQIEEKWKELVFKKNNLPPDQFDNECMGLSAGEGVFQLTEAHLKKACAQPYIFRMWEGWQPYFSLEGTRIPHGINQFWAGIDWGHTARRSYTVLTIGGFSNVTKKFTVVFTKKFMDSNPLKNLDEIAYLLQKFNVVHAIADYGGGYTSNELLAEMVGHFCQVLPCMYAGDKQRFWYDANNVMYKASRTKTLIDTFTQIKAGRVHFYEWSTFRIVAPMYLAEFQDTTEDKRGNVVICFDHADSNPDDALHSFNVLYSAWKAKHDAYGKLFPG